MNATSNSAAGHLLDTIREQVLPTYGNTRTDASAVGRQTTAFREEARRIIHRAVHGESSFVPDLGVSLAGLLVVADLLLFVVFLDRFLHRTGTPELAGLVIRSAIPGAIQGLDVQAVRAHVQVPERLLPCGAAGRRPRLGLMRRR